jgi:hypothetical protein
MISPEATAVNKIAPTRKAAIPSKVDPSKVAIAHFVIPTRERSETGGIRCPPAANHPRVPHPCRVPSAEILVALKRQGGDFDFRARHTRGTTKDNTQTRRLSAFACAGDSGHTASMNLLNFLGLPSP